MVVAYGMFCSFEKECLQRGNVSISAKRRAPRFVVGKERETLGKMQGRKDRCSYDTEALRESRRSLYKDSSLDGTSPLIPCNIKTPIV